MKLWRRGGGSRGSRPPPLDPPKHNGIYTSARRATVNQSDFFTVRPRFVTIVRLTSRMTFIAFGLFFNYLWVLDPFRGVWTTL